MTIFGLRLEPTGVPMEDRYVAQWFAKADQLYTAPPDLAVCHVDDLVLIIWRCNICLDDFKEEDGPQSADEAALWDRAVALRAEVAAEFFRRRAEQTKHLRSYRRQAPGPGREDWDSSQEWPENEGGKP